MALVSAIAERIPDRAFATAIAYAHRRAEPMLDLVKMFVTADQTAVDVGAWYGPWTYWLARAARSVVTVEANPELADFVRRTAPDNVTVITAAASDEAGTATLWLPPGGKGTEGRASLQQQQGNGHSLEVETIRLDSLDVANVGLIKIDVEGHELAALRGAEKLVRRWRPTLIVEIEDSRSPAADTIGLIESWGYEGIVLKDGRSHSLAEFDLVGHQQSIKDQFGHGYLRHVATKVGDRYVNMIVFRPRPDRD
ncbi:FkbM family methyltransferase [Frankia sp. CNm7]|uniref:FkbM family methyltransferase n=1 Tax=Frankia nepalensis TaxID=1836974 RepID=A0A937UUI9_9ACTN|nr:FkbM family methyltransferase [Frankia nepalensis]MBL7495227.1 FkbM family methyltransferase [Frankia nepalensis]MBL7513222.1 FkbM family methyltransferase [Frankia nepalensis]MBL7524102.1 FkbM family methyltransferase [Frankia nepalensis]MBL7631201.1 FkbM family methyltransferase [Frankia nepalensis]